MRRTVIVVWLAGLLLGLATLDSCAQTGDNDKIEVVWSTSIFSAGYTLLAGFDVNNNGRPEFLTYDKTSFTVYLFEATGDDQYDVIWSYTWEGLLSADREFWVEDLNEDGVDEIIALVETDPQKEDALQVFKWNGSEIERILTWDPPRGPEGRIRPETFGRAVDLDEDGVKELIIANRAGDGVGLMIISLANKSYSEPDWRVEYRDEAYWEIKEGEKVLLKAHGIAVGDVNNDDKEEVIIAADSERNLRVYGVTSPDQYELLVELTSSDLPEEYSSTTAEIPVIDLNEDGENELFIFDNKSIFWVITDTSGEIDASWPACLKWHKVIGRETWPESTEMRGGIIGDADADGNLDFYIGADKGIESVYDIEWIGGKGGDVTDPFNYECYTLLDERPHPGVVSPSKIRALGVPDLDGDNRRELVIISGSYSADAADKMLIVMEYKG